GERHAPSHSTEGVARYHVDLRRRPVHLCRRGHIRTEMMDITYHANDLRPPLHVAWRSPERHSLAKRASIAPRQPVQGLVDDYGERPIRSIRVVERSAGHEANAHGFEVAGRDDAIVRHRSIVAGRTSLDFVRANRGVATERKRLHRAGGTNSGYRSE